MVFVAGLPPLSIGTLLGRKDLVMSSNLVLVTANIRALGISNRVCCKKKLGVVLSNLPDLVILTEVCVTITSWNDWWAINRFELSKYTGEFLENGRRGIIVLIKKPLKPDSRVTINNNILKLSFTLESGRLAIFATYAPSHGRNELLIPFFNELRKAQLDSDEEYQIISGDLNTTLDPVLDRTGYTCDNHWRTRELINSWTEDDNGLVDAYRYCNPERKQFTWSKDKSFKIQARLDYFLLSGNLARFLKKCSINHCPWEISDHNPCLIELQFEKVQEGPGTFRCAYGLNKIPEYNLMAKHIMHESVTDICNLDVFSKALEHANNRIIYNLSICLEKNIITPEQRIILGISLSLQRTKAELLACGTEIQSENTLDYVIKKVAHATRIFQREYKKQKVETEENIRKEIEVAQADDDPDRLSYLDGVLNDFMQAVCQEEAEKMSTFRLLNDERPSKAMIELEKTISGYSTIAKMNKPNPSYITPEMGGSPDENINPKRLLMSDPKEIREYLRHFMQGIYNKQDGLNTSKEHLLAYLSEDSDDAVVNELNKRRLSNEERDSLEGPITKEEMTSQLFKHMKPHSAPGIDGFTVDWVRTNWNDLADLSCIAVNACYERGKLTPMLKTAIMKLLRKGDKSRLEATNYRPISLLSVFYKIASGVITRRLDKVINKVIGRHQKAYSREKNITSVLLNIINMIDEAGKSKRSALLIAIDFRKAFDSINHSFIDTCLDTLNFGPSFRSWVKLFFNNRETYLLMHGYMEEKILLEQGVPQGDILSPLIFNIVVEFLLLKIGYSHKITGVVLPGGEARAEAYADDTTIGIQRSEENLRNLVDIIKGFTKLSGLHANLDKTHVMPIGPNSDPEQVLCPELGLSWTSSFKLLGLEISSDLSFLNQNLEKKLLQVESLIKKWERRNLTTPGRVSIAKSVLLAQLVYPMQTLDLEDDTIKKIENLLYGYIKGKTKRNWLSKEIICTPTSKGGLGFFDIKDFYFAQKLTLIRRYAKNQTDDRWCDHLDTLLDFTPSQRMSIFEWGDVRLSNFQARAPKGLVKSFQALAELARKFPNKPAIRDNSWICQPVFSNSNIKVPSPKAAPRDKRIHVISELDCGLPLYTNLKLIDLFEDGGIVSKELLEDRLQAQFPGYKLSENSYLRIKWYIPYIGSQGMFHNRTPTLFPLTRMDLDGNPIKYSSSSARNMAMKIKKGSKPFRKVFEKTHDFLTEARLNRWRETTRNMNVTEDNLRKAYKLVSCRYFSAKQKDKLLKLLCRKTLYNNQIEHAHPDGVYPEWYVSKYCKNCLKDGIEIEEDFYHANFACPTIKSFQRTAHLILGIHGPQPDPNPTLGPRCLTAPTNPVAARGAATSQFTLSHYLTQWLILTVGGNFRTSDFSINDALKMLRDDLNIVTKTSTDLTGQSCRVYYEALSGHLTRPPENSAS